MKEDLDEFIFACAWCGSKFNILLQISPSAGPCDFCGSPHSGWVGYKEHVPFRGLAILAAKGKLKDGNPI